MSVTLDQILTTEVLKDAFSILGPNSSEAGRRSSAPVAIAILMGDDPTVGSKYIAALNAGPGSDEETELIDYIRGKRTALQEETTLMIDIETDVKLSIAAAAPPPA